MKDRWIQRFEEEAVPKLREEFKPEKVMLFGSRTRGSADEASDIDVIMVSSYFTAIPFLKRMPLVLRKVPFPKHVDYLCYTRQEYDRMKGESSLVRYKTILIAMTFGSRAAARIKRSHWRRRIRTDDGPIHRPTAQC